MEKPNLGKMMNVDQMWFFGKVFEKEMKLTQQVFGNYDDLSLAGIIYIEFYFIFHHMFQYKQQPACNIVYLLITSLHCCHKPFTYDQKLSSTASYLTSVWLPRLPNACCCPQNPQN